MTGTAKRILEGAKQCFFRHGFTRSNMSMIAEYAGCSRVTLYKYFESKEALFNAVGDGFLKDNIAEFEALLEQGLSFWQYLEAIIASFVVSPFEQIGDEIIRNDLISASSTNSVNMYDEKERQLINLLQRIVSDASQKDEICIENLGITPIELAKMINLLLNGMARVKMSDLRLQAQQVVAFLKLTLHPSRLTHSINGQYMETLDAPKTK